MTHNVFPLVTLDQPRAVQGYPDAMIVGGDYDPEDGLAEEIGRMQNINDLVTEFWKAGTAVVTDYTLVPESEQRIPADRVEAFAVERKAQAASVAHVIRHGIETK